jgi:hypothetical protein
MLDSAKSVAQHRRIRSQGLDPAPISVAVDPEEPHRFRLREVGRVNSLGKHIGSGPEQACGRSYSSARSRVARDRIGDRAITRPPAAALLECHALSCLAARRGRLHRPDDAQAEPREADVRRRAAFVGHRVAGLPRRGSLAHEGARWPMTAGASAMATRRSSAPCRTAFHRRGEAGAHRRPGLLLYAIPAVSIVIIVGANRDVSAYVGAGTV